jgi:large subunit ribosomal protein LX
MEGQKFEIKGDFRMGEEVRPFSKVIEAPSERQARERVYTLFGSKHRVKRRYITIHSITLQKGE